MITKSEFLVYLEAPRHLWALKHSLYDQTLVEFDKHLIEQGYIVESQARLYAQKYLASQTSEISFQATCSNASFEARADILVKNPTTSKFDIYEVKSVTKPEKENYIDATFQYILFSQKYDIGAVYLLYVNGEYVKQGDFNLFEFFAVEEITSRVKELQPEVDAKMQDCLRIEKLESPKSAPECLKPKQCPCKNICHVGLPEYSIYDLSRVTEKKVLDLRDKDILDIKDIPSDFVLSDNQKLQVQVAKLGKSHIELQCIKEILQDLQYPLYFLDYETFDPAIPMFDGYKPYQHLVFQYSLHVIESSTTPLSQTIHYEFVSQTKSEPSKPLLQHLRNNISDTGTVIVWYKGFECSRNKEMALINPEFAGFLESVNDRVYDLMEIFSRGHYVDPRFKGSTSIKNVLPVLIPELTYKTLEVQNGAMAMVNWFKLVYGTGTHTEKSLILKNLLTYCEQDTWAMVRIWNFLKETLVLKPSKSVVVTHT